MAARLREQYNNTILPALQEKFGRKNVLSIPKMDKIVINMGVGSAVQDKKELADANEALTLIAGQKPVITKARKSIANFRLREGQAIGCKVTLRGDQMYEFMDRLLSLVLPRVRDFRGVSAKAFDGRGNYSLGLTEYVVFPELNPDKFTRTQGMNIVFVTTADNNDEGLELLKQFGMPFQEAKKKSTPKKTEAAPAAEAETAGTTG
jgi:large subunit ribosomal protein L5